jgi:hypothetical protein
MKTARPVKTARVSAEAEEATAVAGARVAKAAMVGMASMEAKAVTAVLEARPVMAVTVAAHGGISDGNEREAESGDGAVGAGSGNIYHHIYEPVTVSRRV